MTARPSRRRSVQVLVAVGTAIVLQISSGTAVAETVADAKTRAEQLRVQVGKLQIRAEVAAEAYDASQGQLADVVTQYIAGERALGELQQKADSDRRRAAGRIIALYQSGGELGIFSTVLSGEGAADIYDRLQMARTVIAGDQSVIADSAASVAQVDAQQAKLSALHDKQRALESLAADRADAARAATDAAQSLLASADDNVRQLVAEAQAAADRAAAEAFARQLAAAQAAAAALPAGPLLPLGAGSTSSSAATLAITWARTKLGVPYLWGGTGPDSFDCSGLTQWAYAHVGVRLPRVAADQYNFGRHIPLSDLAPGDLLFWATDVSNPTTIHHEAMYLGYGRMIAAPHTGAFVREEPVYATGFIGATRPVG